MRIPSVIQAILAAVLFGASTPVAKLLLGKIEPILLASFLYVGSGLSLMLFKGLRRVIGQSASIEAQVSKSDVPWLIGAIFAGGVAAPILLMFGLRDTPAATTSLLLNFEGMATALIAAFVFKEALGRRIWLAIACITTASVLLSWDTGGEWGFSVGAVGVLGACVLWGMDNNFTRNISAKDPLTIVAIKGSSAGAFSLIVALVLRNPLPDIGIALGAMLLGSICYGLSIVLFILAMRGLGAARTSALYGTAPFAGVVLSFLIFRDTPDVLFVISLPLMIVGAILLLGERHSHLHVHTAVRHEHRHRHDDGHHTHEHAEGEIRPGRFHSHLHKHEVIAHVHPHTPDIHHRHSH